VVGSRETNPNLPTTRPPFYFAPTKGTRGGKDTAADCAVIKQLETDRQQPIAANPTQPASTAGENAGYVFVTFDLGRKHLARVVAVNGKKVTARLFNKRAGEWQTKTESRERQACFPLTAAEAEESFPGCVAAWEAAKLPDTLGAGATTIKEDNPNAAALVAAFKKNNRDMEAWRNEAAPMLESLEKDIRESGEIWYGGKRYTSLKKWCEPVLGIKYRAMRYRLTGGNPVSKRKKKKDATVAPKAVTLKARLVVKLAISEQLYVVTEEPVIIEDHDTLSFTLVVESYEEVEAPVEQAAKN
jgi:hypothetical protein